MGTTSDAPLDRYVANQRGRRGDAAGVRGGAMLDDLSALGAVNMLYDASTFDTDPFEPQPDGVNTVFPFLVSRDDGSAYVELPYTLPQDFTLFLLLQETSADIW